jgi:prepilin-type N-terminal cleavage/methylation domain-containing protein
MRKNKGFTLIELLVVIAIIGILAILIFLALGRAQKGARDSQRKAGCRDIATAEAMYYDANKSYGKYSALIDPGSRNNPYMGQTPNVCAQGNQDGADSINSCPGHAGDAVGSWTAALKLDSSRGFVCTTQLENGGNDFVCDKNGCQN